MGLIDVYRRTRRGKHHLIASNINKSLSQKYIHKLSEEAHEVRHRFFNGDTLEVFELLGEVANEDLQKRMQTSDPELEEGYREIEEFLAGE